MVAWRYQISLLVLKKYFTRSLRSLSDLKPLPSLNTYLDWVVGKLSFCRKNRIKVKKTSVKTDQTT